jgi:hypothetical protein
MKLISKKTVKYKGVVNDLSIENSHSYNVEGISVHNSAAGSLVSFLIKVTLIDPIPYGLLFSRFFNASRAYPKHVNFVEYGFIDEFRDYETQYS